jgi:hypothetical protein
MGPFFVDADEELTEEFIHAIRFTLRSDDCDPLESQRIVYRRGRRSPYFTKDNWLIRFFRKHEGHYPPRRVHERISITGTVRRSNTPIIHNQNMTLDELVVKLNGYSPSIHVDATCRHLGFRGGLHGNKPLGRWILRGRKVKLSVIR